MRACHKLVRSVAMEAAGQLYEGVMSNDVVWKEWKKQNPQCQTARQLEVRFIEKNWTQCIEFARATLGLMLGRRDISDEMKVTIYEALTLDNAIPVGKGRKATVDIINKGLLGGSGGKVVH